MVAYQTVSPTATVRLHVCVCAQLCLTLYDSTNCSPWGSSAHGISQARILEWVAISFSMDSFLFWIQDRDKRKHNTCSHSAGRRSYPVTEWELRAEISTLWLSPLLRSPGDRLAPGTLCYSAAVLAPQQQNTALLGQILNKRSKETKNATAASEELGAKAGYCACLLHTVPPKGWAKHRSHPSGPTPRHSPLLTSYKEPVHLPQWVSKQGNLLFVLAPAAAELPEWSVAWIAGLVRDQFLLVKEARNPGR